MPGAEVLDRVNEQDQPIGTVERADVFRLHANFRVAHVFIFNHSEDILLQRLAPNRARHPGRWGSSLAAYVAAGENYAQAATRRLGEELGIFIPNLDKIGKTQMVDDGCRKFITLYAGHHDGPFTLDPTHIAEVEFFSLDQVVKTAAINPSSFTPTFLQLLDFYKRKQPS
jgi:isopentenyldiphosphate isomerase